MQTKFKLIQTDNYILALSDDEVKSYYTYYHCDLKGVVSYMADTPSKYDDGEKKIVSYLPKSYNSPKLNLPYLPEITGVYNDDDLKKAIEMARGIKDTLRGDYFTIKYMKELSELSHRFTEERMSEFEIIKSINQSKIPKWFVAEREKVYHSNRKGVTEFRDTKGFYSWKLKVDTNSNGEKVLIGKYLYE
jgi:hypothetical protein